MLDPPKSTQKKIYVTSKHFDNIGELLSSIGLKYSPFSGKYDCDILFINCGTTDYINPSELADFVRRGGCLYASDLASAHIESAFPGKMEFTNSGKVCTIKADVVDSELIQITGKRIEIKFDLSNWSVIHKSSGIVLLRGATGNEYAGTPIMISFREGNGVAFYTSFHNHAQASEMEKMLLQLLLMKQLGTASNQTVEEVGSLLGLNIASIKDRFKNVD